MINVKIENEKRVYQFPILGKIISVIIEASHPPGIDPVDALEIELGYVIASLQTLKQNGALQEREALENPPKVTLDDILNPKENGNNKTKESI